MTAGGAAAESRAVSLFLEGLCADPWQGVLKDVVAEMRCVQLAVEPSADHRHNVVDVTWPRLRSYQVPEITFTRASTHGHAALYHILRSHCCQVNSAWPSLRG